MVFLHADEFNSQYRSKFLPKFEFPVVLVQTPTDLEIFMDNSTMEACEDLSAFIELIKTRLKNYDVV